MLSVPSDATSFVACIRPSAQNSEVVMMFAAEVVVAA